MDRPRRRVFSAEYKLAMVEEYDRLTEPGAKGALLRREGLYSSVAAGAGCWGAGGYGKQAGAAVGQDG